MKPGQKKIRSEIPEECEIPIECEKPEGYEKPERSKKLVVFLMNQIIPIKI